jgi:hypothetical protein
MASTKIIIDGQTFQWLPHVSDSIRGPQKSKKLFDVFLISSGDRILIGQLKKPRNLHGWLVMPRLGGYQRAALVGKGWASTRAQAVRHLIGLTRSEGQMTVLDKVRLGIVQDVNGTIVDSSAGLPLVPVPADTGATP